MFTYELRCKGSWQLDGPRGMDDAYHGTLTLRLTWDEAIPPPTEPIDGGSAVAPLLSLPLPGTDGNRACEVRPVSALTVPCAMCSDEDGNLSFFDMVVPHFGTAELVSFSCAACGYKYNKVGTAMGQTPSPKGRALRLRVGSDADLKREVVISDAATVRLPALEMEVQAVGRYTTVEGLVTGLASGLAHAAIVSEAGEPDGGVLGSIEGKITALLADCATSPFAVEISDPLALSFIAEPSLADSEAAAAAGVLELEEWERSEEENLDLGLIDAHSAGELWAAANAAKSAETGATPEEGERAVTAGDGGGMSINISKRDKCLEISPKEINVCKYLFSSHWVPYIILIDNNSVSILYKFQCSHVVR